MNLSEDLDHLALASETCTALIICQIPYERSKIGIIYNSEAKILQCSEGPRKIMELLEESAIRLDRTKNTNNWILIEICRRAPEENQ